MATMKVYTRAELDGTDLALGSLTTSQSVTVAGTKYDVKAAVPDDFGEVVLWNAAGEGDGGTTAWSFLWLETDKAVFVEFTMGTPADLLALSVLPGVPLILLADDAAGATAAGAIFGGDTVALVSGTDFGQVTKITAKNNIAGGGGNATVRLVLVA